MKDKVSSSQQKEPVTVGQAETATLNFSESRQD
jgi:hypothetical protein